MAAPTVTARATPTGFKLEDGFKTTIAFAANPGIQFWEKTVKPPGGDGGAPIETSTMFNTKYRTKAPRSLQDQTDASGKAGYDPDCLPGIRALVNFQTSITIHYPTNDSDTFWGFLQKYEIDELAEGVFPMLNYTICITNFDPVNFVEAGPVYTPVAGT